MRNMINGERDRLRGRREMREEERDEVKRKRLIDVYTNNKIH